MLKKILLGIGVIVVVILAYAATMPDTFTVTRSTVINAPAQTVHAQLIDFHNWTAWSPWEKMDPAMKRTYEGATSGKGAAYLWEGNSAVGQGRMEVLNDSASQVDIKLDFKTPMEMSSDVSFALQPQNGGTNVVWTMNGANNYVSKVMDVFMDMDSMIGKDFEAGLADLKKVSEAAAAEKPADAAPAPAATSNPTNSEELK